MKNTFIVSDTNIFIDLFNVSLLDAFFKLPWEIHTPDFVLSELTDGDQKVAVSEFSETGVLKVDTQTPEELMELMQLIHSQNGVSNLSFTDCAVWMLAEKLQCPLLTGDNKLRKKVSSNGIEVHGVLYVFDCLVELGIIPAETAALRLKRLSNKNLRLPEEAIIQRLAKWSSKTYEPK